MTFGELQSLFEAYTQTSGEVDAATLALWFNEAVLDLALSFGNGETYTYEDAVAETAYDLPSDCLRVLESEEDYAITAAGKIKFAEGGDIEITYRQFPTVSFTGVSTSQESDLPEIVHMLLARWAASRYWDAESEGDTEESNHAIKWMQDYRIGKATILNATQFGAQGSLSAWTIVEE